MIKTERKEVTRTSWEYIPVKGICDRCGKEFVSKAYGPSRVVFYDYYRVVINHHNWGNDSYESYEAKDFCCINCMMKFIQDYWDDKRKIVPGHMTHEMKIKHMLQLEEYK